MYLSDMYSVFLYFELSLSIRELRPRIPLLDYAKKHIAKEEGKHWQRDVLQTFTL